MKDEIEKFINQIYPTISWKQEIKNNLQTLKVDGSFVYIAYENDNVLYVGETSKSIYRRFIGDGSGAHNKKDWYNRMTHVCYVDATEQVLPEKHRKLLEQAISIKLNPEFYGKQ
jgi:hypothetical protein